MNLKEIDEVLQLIIKLNDSLQHAKTSAVLAEQLLEKFPQYTVNRVAYRAIKVDWEDGYDNFYWSHSISGCKRGFNSVHGSLDECRIYKAVIIGFDVFQMWSDLEKLPYFKSILSFSYLKEEEILALEIVGEPQLVSKSTKSQEAA